MATLGAGIVGPTVASYTAALIANTAVPVWHDAHRELPYVFVGSAASAAAGLALVTSPVSQAGPARRLALIGVVAELAASRQMEQRLGELVGEPLDQGRAGRLIKASKALGCVGALTGVSRPDTAAAPPWLPEQRCCPPRRAPGLACLRQVAPRLPIRSTP